MALDIKYRIKSIIVNEIDFVTKKHTDNFKLPVCFFIIIN